jgi:hypothetical protein
MAVVKNGTVEPTDAKMDPAYWRPGLTVDLGERDLRVMAELTQVVLKIADANLIPKTANINRAQAALEKAALAVAKRIAAREDYA